MPDLPLLRLQKFMLLPGCAFGQAYPTLLAYVDVGYVGSKDFQSVDRVLDAILEEPVSCQGLSQALAPSEGLLRRLIHIQGSIQRQQKIPVFGPGQFVSVRRDRPTGDQCVLLALPYHDPRATVLSLRWACELLGKLLATTVDDKLVDQAEIDMERFMGRLREYALPGLNSFYFQQAAHEGGIHSRSLMANDVYIYGLGRYSRLMHSTFTDQTTSIATMLARDKDKTSQLLARLGIPTPDHEYADSAEAAVKIAEKMGYPVVIKPNDQDQGRGVAADLRTSASVLAAFDVASKFSKRILVERHQEGNDYRLTVYRDKVIKILHRRAGGVVGDGIHSIADLINAEQQTLRFKRVRRQRGKQLLELDEEVLGILSERGLSGSSIPDANTFVALRRKCNISSGGIQTLVPVESSHPDNLDLAIRASQAIRLDLCGVDLILPDISRSWLETGAAVIELNAKPQIGWTLGPEAYASILADMLPGGGRIPLHLVVCYSRRVLPDADTMARYAATLGPDINGLASPDRVTINGRTITVAPRSGFHAARMLLENTRVSGVLCFMLAEEVSRHGLPVGQFDRIDFIAPAKLTDVESRPWRHVVGMVRDHGHACVHGHALSVCQIPPSIS